MELACGTGRLANSLVRDGADYTGLELSPDFADLAKKKLNQYCNTPTIVMGDMRNFQLNKTYDLVFIGFNSFLHLLTDKDAASFFTCIKNHMHKNSRFLIDIYIPNPLFLYRPEGVRFLVLEYTDSVLEKFITVRRVIFMI